MADDMIPRFREFDSAAFLRDTWQRQALLIPNPWADWRNPLEPDELAGLACEPGIESRLVTGDGLGVEHGPLAEDRFATLGAAPWTLLVQAVDHHVPDVAALIEPFRFLPNWRIDDVMVSYATTGGGVGAHFDQYDVFLIQGAGRRRWRVGGMCDETTPLRPHDDLRLLEDFTPAQEWVLEPGDILYLPPRLAHEGVALSDDCMTYSIGFRAPSAAELLAAWCDEALSVLTEDDRYGDAGAVIAQANPGEITAEALDRLRRFALDALGDPARFARVIGAQATTPRYPEIDWSPARAPSLKRIKAARDVGGMVQRNPACRFAFVDRSPGHCLLFVNSEITECEGPVADCARAICAAPVFALDPNWSDAALALVHGLCATGALALAD
ncbi:cupin domain-containing protein [Novosphingobium aerophilum]|nr:cupin domain-containing protein [Novosphingobium aerophilum]